MIFCQNILQQVIDKINIGNRHKHCILIGENSSGKSEVIRKIIEQKLFNHKPIYFIDAVNRNIKVDAIISEKKDIPFNLAIVISRIQSENFNILDTFSCYGTQTERVEEIYSFYEDELQALLDEFVSITFKITNTRGLGEVDFNGEAGKLSSGFQALTRILLELLYYQHTVIEQNNFDEYYVVVDEIDEFLSPSNSGRIMPFLYSHFPDIRFIVTTHSIDLIVSARDSDIIILSKDGCETLDAEDFNTFSEAAMIFESVFEKSSNDTMNCGKQIDIQLRRLINNKISNMWSSEDEKLLLSLSQKELSNSQRYLYRQIQEWN